MNDHKPILPVSPRNATCLPKQFSAQQQSTKFKNHRNICTKGNIFGSCSKKSFSFQEKLQLNNVKHKQLPPQVVFATLTHDDQIKLKPVHCLVKHVTVLTSLKDDCHSGLAHFGKDQFPTCDGNEGEKNVIKTLDNFSFDAVNAFQVPIKKSITKNAKTVVQHFFLKLIMRIR